jgi:Partial alpha/beta-hydrolase lipase region
MPPTTADPSVLHAAPAAELVQPYGYPLEAHTVQTADGYLLGIFRMPRGVHIDAPATPRLLCAVFMSCNPACAYPQHHGCCFQLRHSCMRVSRAACAAAAQPAATLTARLWPQIFDWVQTQGHRSMRQDADL